VVVSKNQTDDKNGAGVVPFIVLEDRQSFDIRTGQPQVEVSAFQVKKARLAEINIKDLMVRNEKSTIVSVKERGTAVRARRNKGGARRLTQDIESIQRLIGEREGKRSSS